MIELTDQEIKIKEEVDKELRMLAKWANDRVECTVSPYATMNELMRITQRIFTNAQNTAIKINKEELNK